MQINWHAPWLTHLPLFFHDIDKQLYMTDGDLLSDALNHHLFDGMVTASNRPIRFIPQHQLPNGVAYESHIAKTGHIPTRNNIHDLFNASVWFTFPSTKALLNQHQNAEIEKAGISGQRGKIRDALTLFDENGAILVTCDKQIAQALHGFDWFNALVKSRQAWSPPQTHSNQSSQKHTYHKPNNDENTKITTAVYLFGHALMEQLVTPRKPICAHTLTVFVDDDWFKQSLSAKMADLDSRLTVDIHQKIANNELNTRSYQPLPILGVPYFWSENKEASFYQDTSVFRTGRRKK